MRNSIPYATLLVFVGLKSFSADTPLSAPSNPDTRDVPPSQRKPPLDGLITNAPGFRNMPQITNNWPTNKWPTNHWSATNGWHTNKMMIPPANEP